MKKYISLVCLVFAAFVTKAQNTQLPAPERLKLLQPADLVITNISLTSASFSHDIKGWVIKVSITVKNAGQIITPTSNLVPWVQKTGTPWKNIGTNAILIGLKPGESVTKDYVFVDKKRVFGYTDSFSFKVKVDGDNKVKEANENNNESPALSISPSN